MPFDVPKIRQDFPIYAGRMPEKPFVYLDSTATSLKPRQVITAVTDYYSRYSANVFRGIYDISEEATAAYEGARTKIAGFIGEPDPAAVIFTRNASESINLVAHSAVIPRLTKTSNIVTTVFEHHSNFVPWQQVALKTGAGWRVVGTTPEGLLDANALEKAVNRDTVAVAVTAASNVFGTLVDIVRVRDIVRKKSGEGCLIIVDAAQAVPHLPVTVGEWQADFVVFSGHKMLGPTGIGILWGRRALLEKMAPYQYGGDMISEVHRDKTVFNSLPHKFEAGTPHIAGAIGLGAAVDYLTAVGMDKIRQHEKELTAYAFDRLEKIPELIIFGPRDPNLRGGVIAFHLGKIHPHDVAQILNESGVCVRVGYHCAQPLHEFAGIGPTVRASFYIYNDKADVDALTDGLKRVKKILG